MILFLSIFTLFCSLQMFFLPATFCMEEKTSESENLSESRRLTPLPTQTPSNHFLDRLPKWLMLSVVDFLDFKDHFSLALTNKKNFFTWAAVNRTFASGVQEVITLSSDVTELQWSHDKWPLTVASTLIVHINTNKDIKFGELNRLKKIKNLEDLQNLHFTAPPKSDLLIDVWDLFCKYRFDRDEKTVGDRLKSLENLVFEGIAFSRSVSGNALPNLKNIVIKGRAFPSAQQKAIRHVKHPEDMTVNDLIHAKPVRNIIFCRSQFDKATTHRIISNLQSPGRTESRDDRDEITEKILDNWDNLDFSDSEVGERKIARRHFEKLDKLSIFIKENHLDLQGDKVDFEKPWQDGISPILKPWIIGDDANEFYIGYSRHGITPGKSRPRRSLCMQMDEERFSTSWEKFFMFLSVSNVSMTKLLPIINAWTLVDRLEKVAQTVPGSAIDVQKDGSMVLVMGSL